jgi:hypothetical protein
LVRRQFCSEEIFPLTPAPYTGVTPLIASVGSFIQHIRRYASYLHPLSDNALRCGSKKLLTRGYEFFFPGAISKTLRVGFKMLTAVVMDVAIFWDIAPFNPYVNRSFGGMYHFHLQGRKSAEQETSVQQDYIARRLSLLLL